MNTKTLIIAIAAASPMITGLTIDLNAFLKARKTDPTVRFDFAILATRLGIAACLALCAWAGVDATLPDHG